jgi:hypothetical protein
MNKLLVIILTLFIFSCHTSVDRNELDQDSQEIYNLSLDITTGSDTIVRYHLRIPPLPPQLPNADKYDSLERMQFIKWQDSLKQILDTAELFVIVNHKIDTLSNSDITSIQETLSANKNNLEYKISGDTSFNEAIKELCNNKLTFDTIDATKLRTQFKYKIYTDREFPKDKVRQIGTVRFSKVAYSSDRKKSVVYTSLICGGLCGSGQILFFEKLNGVWKYIKSWDMWVS